METIKEKLALSWGKKQTAYAVLAAIWVCLCIIGRGSRIMDRDDGVGILALTGALLFAGALLQAHEVGGKDLPWRDWGLLLATPWLAAFPLTLCTDGEVFYIFLTEDCMARVFGLLIWLMLALFLYALTARAWVGAAVCVTLSMGLTLVNLALQQFRGFMFHWEDLASVATAASVAQNYHLNINNKMVLCVLFWALIIAILVLYQYKRPRPRHRLLFCLPSLGLSLLLFGVLWGTDIINDSGIPVKHWLNSCRSSYICNLFLQIREGSPKKTATYETDLALLETYESDSAAAFVVDAQTPNVVVIMDESYCDMRTLGDLSLSEDVYAGLDAITSTCLSGEVAVSVFGGNTANSEYEFLTGDSLAFYRSGSVVYQTFVKSQLDGMASYFRALGYGTVSMHPYVDYSWNRNVIYPLMGFERSRFMNAFTNVKTLRKFISDECDFGNVYRWLKDNTERPQFIFNITMQNHSSYTREYENETVQIYGPSSGCASAAQYLSLIRDTNEALVPFLEQLKELERPTVVLFFGDHRPSVENEFYSQLLSGQQRDKLTDAEMQQLYSTPYFVWASDGSFAAEDGGTYSLGALQVQLLERLGMPLTAYQKFIRDLSAEYPVVTGVCTVDADGNTSYISESGLPDDPMINAYMSAIYNHVCGSQADLEGFYSLRP